MASPVATLGQAECAGLSVSRRSVIGHHSIRIATSQTARPSEDRMPPIGIGPHLHHRFQVVMAVSTPVFATAALTRRRSCRVRPGDPPARSSSCCAIPAYATKVLPVSAGVWRDSGLWDQIVAVLVLAVRELEQRDAAPTVVIVNSQSVKPRKREGHVITTRARR